MNAQQRLRLQTRPNNPFNAIQRQGAMLSEAIQQEVVVPQLADIAQDFGTINAGTIVMGNGLPLGGGFSGVIQFAEPFDLGGGVLAHYVVYKTDIVQFYITNEGDVLAGGGTTGIGSSGILFNDAAGAAQLGWKSASSPIINPFATIWAYFTGTTPNRSGSMQADVYKESGGNGTTQWIVNHRNGASLGYHELLGQPPYFDFKALDTGQTFIGHYGDYAAPTLVNTSSKTAIHARTVAQNSVGTNGIVEYIEIPYRFLNNSGGNRTITLTIDFGATSLTLTTGNIATSANPHYGVLRIKARNYGSPAVQHFSTEWRFSAAGALGGFVAMTGFDGMWDADAAEDTSAAPKTLTVSITLSATGQGANYYWLAGPPIGLGPYNQ